ncbi:aminopeptidase N [Lacimicrobium alkaliphilum]|uniref:Aminopeptidase N n=1 Tax=Lacimicrobium alkaliphilum TaxID=1526571 RepID=A0ABQ1R2I6_9ALTE|nr:aminopeptidase N [Lacimicrobium alkaliphilum]GGD52398.1 aminopeptidase N [Lacimicrobium alkaliphilum]
MSSSQSGTMKLSDYTPSAFSISDLYLEFDLQDKETRVTAVSQIRKLDNSCTDLDLDGKQLTLKAVWVNGIETTVTHTEQGIRLTDVPDQFELKIETLIDPVNNHALEGLYKSGGAFCTQCEAQGFRRITYFLDRPDVMAKYRVKLIADKQANPYLLANGNLIDKGEAEQGRHWALWEDPFPKPCYLFALVAGDFDKLDDTFTTCSGKQVKLQLFVDKGNVSRGRHALDSLKKAMAWDEQKYGLEYDLDIYMVVAVDFFNMGAMENKGLNIFNSKYVLADAASATDQDYFNIESVIAHEYFHNWTGNRITCRDWFQLSLKEGLTVFRDQQFSADMASAAIVRINQVKIMREHQFAEDSGPMAHPIRPSEVMEMNNFYSVTVYDKGAEVIRMLHTLLGESGFRRGMDCYIERHDGQAVTCDDFVQAMEDANQKDLSLFRRWYSQSGTPVISVNCQWHQSQQQLRLELTQNTAPTADQSIKQPLHIPVGIEIVTLSGGEPKISEVLSLTEQKQTYVFENIPSPSTVAVLTGFSAPAKLNYQPAEAELMAVILHASDAVTRWDASQQLISEAIFKFSQRDNEKELPESLKRLFQGLLGQAHTEPALIAEMLELPSFETLSQQQEKIDLDALLKARKQLKALLAVNFAEHWRALFEKLSNSAYSYEQTQVERRRLSGVCLSYLACLDSDESLELLQQAYEKSDNMTDTLAVLKACQAENLPLFDSLMQDFEQKWHDDSLVMDKWFALHAGRQHPQSLSNLQLLMAHSRYSINNPNRVRSVMGTFAFYNTEGFHRRDGSGYKFLTDYLLELDSVNPQVAARLITPMIQYAKLDEHRQHQIRLQLLRLFEHKTLSRDLYEKVQKAL